MGAIDDPAHPRLSWIALLAAFIANLGLSRRGKRIRQIKLRLSIDVFQLLFAEHIAGRRCSNSMCWFSLHWLCSTTTPTITTPFGILSNRVCDPYLPELKKADRRF
jgi:hypothetical protein